MEFHYNGINITTAPIGVASIERILREMNCWKLQKLIQLLHTTVSIIELPLSFTFLLPFQNFVKDPPIDNFFLFFLSTLGGALPLISGGGDPGSCDEDDIEKLLCSTGL